ncbi:MAG: GNAT family N-acetyltransferase [Acidobacteriota bacterium]
MTRVRLAEADDRDWIDECHRVVRFELSDERAELHAIAEVDGDRAAVGRILRIGPGRVELGGMFVDPRHRGRGLARSIVTFLLESVVDPTIYCIPFSHLVGFYESFGFRPLEKDEAVPELVAKKVSECEQAFPEGVALLVLERPGTSTGAP